MKQSKPWIKKEVHPSEMKMIMESKVSNKNPRYIRDARPVKKFLDTPEELKS
jgi:hypothetical protein